MSRRYHADGTWTNYCERASCRRQCHSERGEYRWATSWEWPTDAREVHHEFCSTQHAIDYMTEHADEFDADTLASYGITPATSTESRI